MAKAAATDATESAPEDSAHVTNLKFREKDISEKIERIKGMKDTQFDRGFTRKTVLDRAQNDLKEIRAELKLATQ